MVEKFLMPPCCKKARKSNKAESISVNDWIDMFEKFEDAKKSQPKLTVSSFLRLGVSVPQFSDLPVTRNHFHETTPNLRMDN